MKALPTIDEHELMQVTGGQSPAPTKTTTTGGGDNDAVLKALQGIQASLKDLGQNQNNGLFGGNTGLMFMCFAMAMSRRGEVAVSGGRNGFSYSWRGAGEIMSNQLFESITHDSLARVAGGKTSTDQQLQLMLTQIGSSIKEVANAKNNQSDPMMMMMMVMMMAAEAARSRS